MPASRLAVMAHYDREGAVAPHVRRQVEALASSVEDLVIVSTASLSDESRTWLRGRGELIERANYGYDFFSYKTGLESRDLGAYDEVVICNDTYVGPFRPYSRIFDEMAEQPLDFWGLSTCERHLRHVQSFFAAFRPWVVESRAFTTFWSTMAPLSDRLQVIRKYEVGMSQVLSDAGFVFGAYFNETPADMELARKRVEWWAAHRVPYPPEGLEIADYDAFRSEFWNPATAFADLSLDGGRMPYVKIDTLRYDPYFLGADKLLGLCESRLAEAFAGVREYLDLTSSYYPDRQSHVFPASPELEARRSRVEYGCAL